MTEKVHCINSGKLETFIYKILKTSNDRDNNLTMFHCRVLPPGEFNSMISRDIATSDLQYYQV